MLTEVQVNELYEKAECKGSDVTMFYPSEDDRISYLRARHAITVFCSSCPVKGLCREHARDDPYGIWGGVSGMNRV